MACSPMRREVSPGSTVTFVLRIKNLSPSVRTLVLAFSLPESISLIHGGEEVRVGPGQEKLVLLGFYVSEGALAGDYALGIEAHPEGEPAEAVELIVTVVVLEKYGVKLLLPLGKGGWPGYDVVYTIGVLNTGNVRSTYRLSVSSRWPAEFAPEELTLSPGEEGSVSLTIHIPQDAKVGDVCVTRIHVAAVDHPSVEDVGLLTTTVSPLPPEKVETSLYPVVPLRVAFKIDLEGGNVSFRPSVSLGGKIDARRTFLVNVVGGIWSLKYAEPEWEVSLNGRYATELFFPRDIGIIYRVKKNNYTLSFGYSSLGPSTSLEWEGQDGLKTHLQIVPRNNFLGLAVMADSRRLRCVLSGEGISLAAGWHGGKRWARASFSWTYVGTLAMEVSLGGRMTSLKGGFRLGEDKGSWNLSFSHKASFPMASLSTSASCEYESGTDTSTLKSDVKGILRASHPPMDLKIETRIHSACDLQLGTCMSETDFVLDSTFQIGNALRGFLSYENGEAFELGVEFTFSGTKCRFGMEYPGDQERFFLELTYGENRLELSTKGTAVSLDFGFGLSVPLPLFKTKAQVTGEVFVDKNANGRKDPGEEGMGGVLLKMDGQVMVTDAKGFFRFPPVFPGEYAIEVYGVSTDEFCIVSPLKRVILHAGEVKRVDFPLVPAATLIGEVSVWEFASLKTQKLVKKGPLAHAHIILRQGEKVLEVMTDENGIFIAHGLCPGVWRIVISGKDIPRFHYVEKEEYLVKLSPAERKKLSLRILPKRRRIMIIKRAP